MTWRITSMKYKNAKLTIGVDLIEKTPHMIA